MPERITIMLDEDLVRKLRTRQAKILRDTNKSISFSKVLNEVIRDAL